MGQDVDCSVSDEADADALAQGYFLLVDQLSRGLVEHAVRIDVKWLPASILTSPRFGSPELQLGGVI